TFLDFGCASGRILRHMFYQAQTPEIWGCDINRRHVEWVSAHLPGEIRVFQNTSLPHLPLPDSSVDVITAFSVFTHIESFDTAWLMELRRILKPNGIAWLTVHADRTWREMTPDWPIYNALVHHKDYAELAKHRDLPAERIVFRWHGDRSYSANVFYREEYLRR